jgi:hypothetical protein
LPGGRAVLFTITSQTGGLETAQVAVRDLRTGTHTVLLRGGSHGHYVASGHLVYVAAGTLRAIPIGRQKRRGSDPQFRAAEIARPFEAKTRVRIPCYFFSSR